MNRPSSPRPGTSLAPTYSARSDTPSGQYLGDGCPMGRSLASSALIGLGIVMLLAAFGIAGYATYAEWQATSRVRPGPRETLPAQVAVAPVRPDTRPPPA